MRLSPYPPIAILILLVVGLLLLFAPAKAKDPILTAKVEVLGWSNIWRCQVDRCADWRDGGKRLLAWNWELANAAQWQADWLVKHPECWLAFVKDKTKPQTAHDCAGEPDLLQRAQAGGYKGRYISENIAWPKLIIPGAVVAAWMNSTAGHREAILDPIVQDMGAGIAWSAEGYYIFCQVLGRVR